MGKKGWENMVFHFPKRYMNQSIPGEVCTTRARHHAFPRYEWLMIDATFVTAVQIRCIALWVKVL
jgi:hypothetical protein